MTPARRRMIACVAAIAICAWPGMPAHAQLSDKEGKAIKQLLVKDNRTISSDTIFSKVKTKAGDPFSQEVLNEDLKRLYATEYFTDVSIDVEDYEDGVRVTFIVEEKSVIDTISFRGNRILKDAKLRSAMKSKPDEMLNLSLLAQDVADIKNLYVKKGYPLVEVRYELDADKELNKTKVTIVVDEGTRVKVAKITITGNKHLKTGAITKILGTKPAWFFNPGVFKDEIFQEDLDKIRSMYDDIGFLDVEMVPKMDYSEDGKLLYITIEVKENRQYKVGNIEIKGNLTLPEKDIRKQIKMTAGKPFSNKGLRTDALTVRQHYQHYGYMNVVIDVERNANPDTNNVDIVYNIDSKDLVYVGKIDIHGNTKTKELVVRRELRIYPGDKFDGNKLKRSKERLYNIGLFEDLNFDTEETADPNVQDLLVSVKEGKTGEFSFGGGYSSIDQLIGFVEVSQRNFDLLNFPTFVGAGQSLSVRAELGMVRRNFNVSWTEPWIFGYPYSFGFDIYSAAHKRATDVGWAYDETRSGGDLRLGKEITDWLRADAMYRLEEVRMESVSDNASPDLKAEEGSNWISSGSIQLTLDTRDNVYVPTKGFMVNGAFEDAGGIFFGDKNFIKATGSAAVYYTFLEKFTLEVKGRLGIIDPYGDSQEVPIYERFFAGGANTIRGYRERAVSPRDPGSNDPIGGEALTVGNAELTFPVYEKVLKGAIFYDVGNVWRRAGDFLWGGNYRQGVGIGVRVKTPIGPFKLDYGYPLTQNYEDEKKGELYFSISRGF